MYVISRFPDPQDVYRKAALADRIRESDVGKQCQLELDRLYAYVKGLSRTAYFSKRAAA